MLLQSVIFEILQSNFCYFRAGGVSPQALRFSQGRGERPVMNRKGPWEGYRQLLPAFLWAHIFIERERRLGTRQEPGHFLFDLKHSVSCILGNLAGDRERVQWNPIDFILLMIKGITATLSAPDVDWMVEMTPVDFVSEMIVKMTQVGLGVHYMNY